MVKWKPRLVLLLIVVAATVLALWGGQFSWDVFQFSW